MSAGGRNMPRVMSADSTYVMMEVLQHIRPLKVIHFVQAYECHNLLRLNGLRKLFHVQIVIAG
jgi:hypothetical protein